ncbi:MAG: hypothetical protein ACLU6Y_09080 [Ruminococcus sp.]
MNNEERKDIEDKINDAMAQIVSDTAGELRTENDRSSGQRSARPSKSARPRKISYVPIDESEFDPIVLPEKKKHKGLKVTGLIAAMVLVAAGCAYAGCLIITPITFLKGQQSTESTVRIKQLTRLSRKSPLRWQAIPLR